MEKRLLHLLEAFNSVSSFFGSLGGGTESSSGAGTSGGGRWHRGTPPE